jgi:hypothetical protein
MAGEHPIVVIAVREMQLRVLGTLSSRSAVRSRYSSIDRPSASLPNCVTVNAGLGRRLSVIPSHLPHRRARFAAWSCVSFARGAHCAQ